MNVPQVGGEVFTSKYPPSEAAVIPEYFREPTIEGLTPGDCVYPYANPLIRDKKTGKLFIATKNTFAESDKDLDYLDGKAGIMRVCRLVDGAVASYYVADMRYCPPDGLPSDYLDIEPTDDALTQDHRRSVIERDGIVRVVAAVFRDPDGEPHFVGDDSFQSHVQALMVRTDELAEGPDRAARQAADTAGGIALARLTDHSWRIG